MLYFARHGQTDYNLNKLLAGRVDIELNDNGINQARQLKENSKDHNFDVIFVSPLRRAKQTCSIINELHNAIVIVKEELIERDFGKYESCEYGCIDGSKAWNYYLDAYKEDMETLKEVFERVYAFLDKIEKEYKDKNILILAHNDIGRAIHCYFNGIPSDGNLLELNMPNAKIIEYDFKNIKHRTVIKNI